MSKKKKRKEVEVDAKSPEEQLAEKKATELSSPEDNFFVGKTSSSVIHLIDGDFKLACNSNLSGEPDEALGFSHVSCKNCMKSTPYREWQFEQEKKRKAADAKSKKVQEERKEKSEKKIKERKSAMAIPEGHVMLFVAQDANGEPLLTTVANDIDVAKLQFAEDFAKPKNKSKLNKWNRGGKTIVSKLVPNQQVHDYYKEMEAKMMKAFDTVEAMAVAMEKATSRLGMIAVTLHNAYNSGSKESMEVRDRKIVPIRRRKIIKR